MGIDKTFQGIRPLSVLQTDTETFVMDSDCIANAIKDIDNSTSPQFITVLNDISVEAEILGCDISWDSFGKAKVSLPPIEGDEKRIPCDCNLPTDEDGRMPFILEAIDKVADIRDAGKLCGVVCGPLTLAYYLRGEDYFLDIEDDVDYALELAEFCGMSVFNMSGIYMDADINNIIIQDPLLSRLSTDKVKEVFADVYENIFDFIDSRDAKVMFVEFDDIKDQTNVIRDLGIAEIIDIKDNTGLFAISK